MRRATLLCFAIAALSALGPAGAAAEAKAMSVTVKETQVRAKPSYTGKILGTVAYADRVQVLEQKNGWARISMASKKLEGWINESALTSKKVVLSSGSGSVSQEASSGDVALAGKGFNEQIESENRKDSSYDYAAVDELQRITVAQEAVAAFLKAGFLSGGEE